MVTGASPAGAPVLLIAPKSHGPLRVVLDTNVLLSLFVFADSRFTPLRHAVEDGRWLALTAPRCLAEFRHVIARPMFGLDAAAQAAALATYTGLAHLQPEGGGSGEPLPQCKDADDQKFLELARDGQASLLVTSDKALLKLARRRRLAHLFRIVVPEAALALLDESAIVGGGEAIHAHGRAGGHP